MANDIGMTITSRQWHQLLFQVFNTIVDRLSVAHLLSVWPSHGPRSVIQKNSSENPFCPVQVQAVRRVLHVAAAPLGQVPLCRQTQVADLQAFLGQGIQECRGGSIYVSGVPGTGTCSQNPCPHHPPPRLVPYLLLALAKDYIGASLKSHLTVKSWLVCPWAAHLVAGSQAAHVLATAVTP